MSISCIIPTYKEPDYLDLCLHSAVTNKRLQNTEIIVVVDGFYELNKSILDKWKDFIRIIKLAENRGIQTATNLGVWAANNEYVLIVNDDNVFPKGWDARMHEINVGENYHISFNQIEPGVRCPVGFGFTEKNFGSTCAEFNLDDFESFEEGILPTTTVIDYSRGNTLPVILSKKAYMTVGGWDTIYDSPHVCDCDFFAKLELMGSKMCTERGISFYHFSGKATKFTDDKDSHEQYQQYSEREMAAWQMFKMKWGYMPGNSPSNSKLPPVGITKGIRI